MEEAEGRGQGWLGVADEECRFPGKDLDLQIQIYLKDHQRTGKIFAQKSTSFIATSGYLHPLPTILTSWFKDNIYILPYSKMVNVKGKQQLKIWKSEVSI